MIFQIVVHLEQKGIHGPAGIQHLSTKQQFCCLSLSFPFPPKQVSPRALRWSATRDTSVWQVWGRCHGASVGCQRRTSMRGAPAQGVAQCGVWEPQRQRGQHTQGALACRAGDQAGLGGHLCRVATEWHQWLSKTGSLQGA